MSIPEEQAEAGQKSTPFYGLAILAIVGAVFSAILVYHHTSVAYGFQTEPSSCNISESLDCDRVAKSSYSTFLGVPVASYSLLYNILLAALSLFGIARKNLRRECLQVAVLFSTLALVPTIFLLAVSYLEISTFCLYCLVLDLQNFAVFLVAALAASREGGFFSNLMRGGTVFFRGVAHLFRFSELVAVPQGIIFWAVVSVLCAVLFLPGFLVLGVFAPKFQRNMQDKATETILKDWTESAPLDVVVREEGEDRDYVWGDKDAPITIVEFSDFECCSSSECSVR